MGKARWQNRCDSSQEGEKKSECESAREAFGAGQSPVGEGKGSGKEITGELGYGSGVLNSNESSQGPRSVMMPV